MRKTQRPLNGGPKRFVDLRPEPQPAAPAPSGLDLPLMALGLAAACYGCSVSGHENPNWGHQELARGVCVDGGLWTAQDVLLDGVHGVRLELRPSFGPATRVLFIPYEAMSSVTLIAQGAKDVPIDHVH